MLGVVHPYFVTKAPGTTRRGPSPGPLGTGSDRPHRPSDREDIAMTNLNLSLTTLNRLALLAIVVVTLLPLVPYAL